MRKLLTILNIVLLFSLVALSLYVFDVIDLSFLNKPDVLVEELPENAAPVTVARQKSYEELMEKGDTYYTNDMYTLAIDSYTKASEADPNKLEPLLKIGELNIQQRNYEQVKNLAISILQKRPTNIESKLLLGRANIGLEQYTEAKNNFDSITSDEPAVLYYQSITALFFGDYERARKLINKLNSKEIPKTLRARSDVLIKAMNEFDLYQAGLHEHLKVLVARALVQNEQPQMAKDLIWQVLQERRDYRDAWIILGYSYLKLERYQESIDALEEAIRQDPEKPESMFYLGLAYAGNDEVDKAIEILELAQKFGYEPKIHVEQKLAELYFQAEDYDKASEKYEEVISRNADNLTYFIRPVWVYIDKVNKPDKAVALAEKALVYHPDQAMSYNLLGWAQVANNDFINAKKNLQKALTLDPNFDAPYLNLGWMYERQGQNGRAKDLYKKAYELGNDSPVGHLAAEKYNALIVNVFNY